MKASRGEWEAFGRTRTVLIPDPSRRELPIAPHFPPTLVVVIDAEEELDWKKSFSRNSTTTENIGCQTKAQAIMDRYGIIPTYVVDYPVAHCSSAASILREIADSGRCE